MRYVKNNKRLYVHRVERDYVLATYYAGMTKKLLCLQSNI